VNAASTLHTLSDDKTATSDDENSCIMLAGQGQLGFCASQRATTYQHDNI
jgi:hypothetical protein